MIIFDKYSPVSYTHLDVYKRQAYANLSYRWLNLSIGSKERLPELKNSKLSSGGMVESNNARPIPQIRLEVPDYVAIPGTHKWLHLKGHIAYGLSLIHI